jgi:antitoxin MazE
MQASLRKIGNSSGVVLPKTILVELGVKTGDKLDLSIDSGKIVLSPVKRKLREGWAEDSKALAAAGEDKLVWPEFGNLDDEKLEW